jgi:type II secretory pathway pseudopilin PulG
MTGPNAASARRAEHGFTLVELLVVLMTGIIIVLATFTVLDVSMRQSARVTDRIEADQRGRTAMEQLVQELHSSCVASAVTPVVAGSDGSNIQFLSQFGSAPVLTPDLHKVGFASGALTDNVFASTGGTSPNWTFSSTATSSKLLGTNFAQAAVSGVTQPVFQYYGYVSGQLSTTPLPTPLSTSDAASTAQVTISFAAQPLSTSTEADRTVNLSDSVVLRYAPASTVIANPPCQ